MQSARHCRSWNIRKLNRQSKKLAGAKMIYLFGVGASGLVAQDFQQKLLRINKHPVFYPDTHAQMAQAVFAGPGDVAVGISHSGRSVEVYKALDKAKRMAQL